VGITASAGQAATAGTAARRRAVPALLRGQKQHL
jgi:hypothetical protein